MKPFSQICNYLYYQREQLTGTLMSEEEEKGIAQLQMMQYNYQNSEQTNSRNIKGPTIQYKLL
jgi:hypothetical protein